MTSDMIESLVDRVSSPKSPDISAGPATNLC